MKRLTATTVLRLMRPRRLAFYNAYRESQWWSTERLLADRDERLTVALRHACRHVPFWRDAAGAAGLDPDSITAADLGALPAVDKSEMRDRLDDFLADDCTAADRIPNHTGGSTGTPFRFFLDRRDVEGRHAIDMRCRNWAGWELGDRTAMLWGHLGDVKGRKSLTARLKNALLNRILTLNAYTMSEAAIREYRDRIDGYGPSILIGYASALAFMAGSLGREGLAPPALKGIISSAETLTDEQRATVESWCTAPLLNRYGSREMGVVAQQCKPDGGFHVNAERLVVEVLGPDGRPCADGEQGEIVVTDLENRAMPFIRYRTGDLAVVGGSCDCGRGLPVLSRIEGRMSDVLQTVDGRYISCPGPRLYSGGIDGIAQMQVIQEKRDALRVKLVPDALWNDERSAELQVHLRGLVGDVNVEIELVDEIPKTASGKYRFAISHLERPGG